MSYILLCVFQISYIKLRCRHPQAWRKGGTLPIWVRAPHLPLDRGSALSSVSAVVFTYIYIECMWRRFSTRWEKQKNNVSHHLACTHRLCCDITRLHFQIYSFYVLSTTHSSFCLPISLWAPAPFLSLPLTALSLSHTPFSLFNSVFQSKYYLTSFQQLSTSQQLFFFPPLPCSAPLLIAVTSVLQWGELFSYVFQALKRLQFLYACSGYSAVYWIKNKQGGIHCSRRKGLQQRQRSTLLACLSAS